MEPGADLRVGLSLSYIGEHLERYSHIRSQAKQAAIQTLEERAGESILEQRGTKSGTVTPSAVRSEDANSLETNGGPARIRTWDQRIMSPLL